MKLSITKTYADLPFGHRQHSHSGHCAMGHGHNLALDLTFTANELDETGFILDFGKMSFVKEALEHQFDHTFLICEDDPALDVFVELDTKQLIDLRIMKSVSAEYIAEWVMCYIGELVGNHTNGRVKLFKVVVWEDSKNSATLEN